MDAVRDTLICPITGEIFEDPVNVPCCGGTFSRLPLQQWLETNCASQTCPSCRGDLSQFDPLSARRNVVIANLIDSLGVAINPTAPNRWTATLSNVYDHSDARIPVSKLEFSLTNSNFAISPSLFIAVVDKSGSMSGTGWTQVQAALNHIVGLTRSNPLIKTLIVTYDSTARQIPMDGSLAEVQARIAAIRADGGTVFRNAYNVVRDILAEHTYSTESVPNFGTGPITNVSNVVIAFLTDGQDNDTANRQRLTTDFRDMLANSWAGPVSVHTIGFGTGCDRNLLEEIRTAGQTEGTFRYAEPTDDTDTLCQKLTSIFEVASRSASVPLKITLIENGVERTVDIQFPINAEHRGHYTMWVNCTDLASLTISSEYGNFEPIQIPVSVVKPRRSIYEQWLALTVDRLATQLYELSRVVDKTKVFDLHCALLAQRIDALLMVAKNEDTLARLMFLTTQVNDVREGSVALTNMGKLSDMRFASQFAVVKKSNATENTGSAGPANYTEANQVDNPSVVKTYNKKEYMVKYTRNNAEKGRNALQEAIMNRIFNSANDKIRALIESSTLSDILAEDVDGNNTLHLAAYCGQIETVQLLIDKYGKSNELDIDRPNRQKETAVTLAIKCRGFHKTLLILLGNGATIPSSRFDGLLQYSVDHKYSITASILTSMGAEKIDPTRVDTGMKPEYIAFLYEQAKTKGVQIHSESYLTAALFHKMVEFVKILISRHNAVPSIEMLNEYCIPTKNDDQNPEILNKYIELVSIILEARPELLFTVDKNSESALFKAAEKGSAAMVKFLAERKIDGRGAIIDQPNILGNTPLWIACAKRHSDVVDELVRHNANVNHANEKGNVPLYTICKMGPKKIADTLIMNGAIVDIQNGNEDTLLLIACRGGQTDIVEMILNYVTPEFVNYKTKIDGFNAIFASVEADKPECIRVLAHYGVDLNQRTDPDNPIIANATPLHLAAYYNRESALRTLLELGADPNLQDTPSGFTPLHIAVIQGNMNIIRLIRSDPRTRVNTLDSTGCPASSYCRSRNDIRKILVNPALDILMSLARGQFSREEEAQALVVLRNNAGESGYMSPASAVNITDNDGSTPLMVAIQHSAYNVVSTLLEIGADPTIRNQFGLNCFFWTRVLKNPRITSAISAISVDPNSAETDEQAAAFMEYSRQYPGLLFLIKPDDTHALTVSGIDVRMEQSVLPESTSSDRSVSTLDLEFKTGSETSKGAIAPYLERPEIANTKLLWNARLHVISLIAGRSSRALVERSNLQSSDLMALCLYTNNAVLSQIIGLPEFGYAQLLTNALTKCEPFAGECFVGCKVVDRSKFTPGSEVVFKSFISSSTMWRVAIDHVTEFQTKKHLGTVFILKSKTGRYVGSFSQFPYDSEVLFAPGTRFNITAWYRGDVMALGQANIRAHTFKVRDEDYPALLNSQSSLLIELTEI